MKVLFSFCALLLTFSAWAQTGEWQTHTVRQGDGVGGFIERPADKKLFRKPDGLYTYPMGIQQMDNGEILLLVTWHNGAYERPLVTLSADNGDTWSDFIQPEGSWGRPWMLIYLGGGNLSFRANKTFFSADYGRTWTESVDTQPSAEGYPWGAEGNALVDRNAQGNAVLLGEVGWIMYPDMDYLTDAFTGAVRWSDDGGRTWRDQLEPPAWRYTVPYEGQDYVRGVSEGSLVRAANGWLVAALRTDYHPRYLGEPRDDSLEGTGVSISKDNGQTWSKPTILFDAGRHHAHLLRLPNDDLLMTLIVRADVRNGVLASHRRGCDALISHDNGQTWNLQQRFEIDAFDYYDPAKWYDGECGHLGSAILADGRALTAYGQYTTGSVVMVRWNPADFQDPSELPAASPKMLIAGIMLITFAYGVRHHTSRCSSPS